MNIDGTEAILIGTAVSGLLLTLFICVGKRALNLFEGSNQSRPNIDGPAFGPESRRKKIARHPAVICSLPIHQTARPEAPLW
jgi:hypothetical protein